MTITANWGLGETVVSGHVEPDTVIVSADTGMVTDTVIGSKLVRYTAGIQSDSVNCNKYLKACD